MITIKKAIERLSEEKVTSEKGLVDTLPCALQLGIEALKYIRCRDNRQGVNTRLLLPGETKE